MEHKDIPASEMHAPHQWRVADQAALDAVVPLAGEQGKYLLKLDDLTEWMLLQVSPPVWRIKDQAPAVTSVNAVAPVSGNVTLTTGNIPEGAGQYFTAARVRSSPMTGIEAAIAAASAANPLDSDDLLVVLAKLRKLIIAAGGGGSLTSTDDLAEGSTNLYFQQARVLTALLAGVSTGTNAAIANGITVLDALERLQAQASAAVASLAGKASASGLATHVADTANPHGTTAAQVGLGSVENKSSATIRGELTSGNVTGALGFTPFDATNVDTSTALGTSNTKVPSQLAVKTYIDGAVSGLWDMKGGTDASANPNYPAASKGDAYAITVAGKIGGASGITVDIGDIYVALSDNAGGTQASVGSSWLVIEHNLVGALLASSNLADLTNPGTARANLGLVIGSDVQAFSTVLGLLAALTPAANKLPYFTGGSGAALADLTAAGRALLDDADNTAQRTTLGLGTAAVVDTGTGAANVPTTAQADLRYQPLDTDLTAIAALTTTTYGRAFLALADAAAARTALALGTAATLDSDNDSALAANSSTRLATQQAVKAYIDALLAANDAMIFKGVIDCSANPNYPAASAGHVYKVSVAGKIGGASGTVVEVGDTILCITDGTSAGTQAAVGANWNVSQANLDGAVIGPASVTASNIAIFSGTTGKVLADGGKALPTGTIVGTSDAQTLTSKTLTSPTITGGTVDTFAIGYRNIPQISQIAPYTAVLTDAGKHIFHPSADTTARTFTIPANSSVAYDIGTSITFINQNGAGVVTIAITTDTMRLAGAGTTGSRTLAANGIATATKVTSTEWIINGTGLT